MDISRATNSVVCVKQVPDTKQVTGDAMRADGTVNRAALPAIFNPDDMCALEAALRVRDQVGGTVSVLTMGLPSSVEVLRKSLFSGADAAYLVTDRRAAASDTLATSYILSCAIARISPDLVFCGKQAIDGDTAQVGPQIAEKLGFALVTYAESVSLHDGRMKSVRNTGSGRETVLTDLPALITVSSPELQLRPSNMRRIMKYKNADPTIWNLDDIGADIARCGKSGSPTSVAKLDSVVLSGGSYRAFEPTAEGIGELMGLLSRDHTFG